MRGYLRRLAARGAARKGLAAYRYQLRAMLLSADRLARRSIAFAELFRDEGLLGRVVVDDTAPALGTPLSKWTLAQRRSAIRSFATLMRPELAAVLGTEPTAVLDGALRTVAERVGTGYRLTGGAPRRRGGYVPTRCELTALLGVAGQAPGYAGARNEAFFRILAETGARVNALRELDGANCVVMPNGGLRIFLHEKGKAEAREVELSRTASDGLRVYIAAFNRHAAVRRWAIRLHPGEPGSVWRNSARGRWAYSDVRFTLRAACAAAGVPAFTPHALRRAFATQAASLLPRHVVALAGGWNGLERLDDHYVHPRRSTIWEKLWQGGAVTDPERVDRSEDHAAALVP